MIHFRTIYCYLVEIVNSALFIKLTVKFTEHSNYFHSCARWTNWRKPHKIRKQHTDVLRYKKKKRFILTILSDTSACAVRGIRVKKIIQIPYILGWWLNNIMLPSFDTRYSQSKIFWYLNWNQYQGVSSRCTKYFLLQHAQKLLANNDFKQHCKNMNEIFKFHTFNSLGWTCLPIHKSLATSRGNMEYSKSTFNFFAFSKSRLFSSRECLSRATWYH